MSLRYTVLGATGRLKRNLILRGFGGGRWRRERRHWLVVIQGSAIIERAQTLSQLRVLFRLFSSHRPIMKNHYGNTSRR